MENKNEVNPLELSQELKDFIAFQKLMLKSYLDYVNGNMVILKNI